MTISSTNRKAGPYSGNDVATAFPFSFKVFAGSDLYVVSADAYGTETVLTLTTHYTVSLNADQNANPGGTITLPSALASGSTLTITSALSYLQPTDLTNQGGFYPKVITNALDRLTIFAQQLAEQLSRALKYSISSPLGDSTLPAPVANNVIGWNSSANGFKNYAPVDNTLLAVDLASTAAGKGAALVGYKAPGTGSTARTVDDKFSERPSLFDFMTTAEKLNVVARLGTLDVTAAILAAIAANPGRRIFAPAGRYIHSSTIAITVDGTWLSGESNGGYEFGPDTGTSASNYGTVFEWGGAAGGMQMLFGPAAAATTARTIGGGGIENIRLIGLGANAIGTNAVATGLRMADVSNSEFKNIKISGATSVQLDLTGYVPDHSYLNSVYGCTFDNFKLIAGGTAKGMYAGPTANVGGGDHPCFCRFSNFHITHADGIAVHLDEIDDCEFNTLATSRLAGYTGDSIVLEGNGEGIHFRCVNTGYTITGAEAVPKVWVKGGNRAIYFEMAGIDDNVRPTIDAGAECFYMYLGSNNIAFVSEFRSPVIRLPNIVKGEANYLDWYEEGTFTPTVAFSGASVGITYSQQLGRYVRIGRTVFITLSFTLSSKGSSVGTAQIAGLPWTASSNNSSYGPVRPIGGWVPASVDRGIGVIVTNSAVVATLVKNVSGSGGMSAMTDADFGATSQLATTFNYEV